MKGRKLLCSAAMTLVCLTSTAALADTPKYVFFFLGDGMSAAQIQAAEAYLTTVNGGKATEATDLLKPENRLNMSTFPVMGMQTTFDAHALMTDSASSGTAFACGIKTLSGVIGMDDKKEKKYKSIAQKAFETRKMRVGVISSVSLDHATPASYYASVASRSDMNTIASQMADTGYEFFGGGGLVSPTSPVDVWGKLSKNGYTVLKDKKSILDLKQKPKSKVVCINPELQDSQSMPYAIDSTSAGLTLAEMTEVAIQTLLNAPNDKYNKLGNGFFLAVEGGKIDWACHANDAKATIGDTLAFDDAVGVALNFYRMHPHETLIVVTGDHETGGMAIGHATTGYTGYYDRLLGQTKSFQAFGTKEWPAHKAAFATGYDWTATNNLESNAEMIGYMKNIFGLDYASLNAYQKEKLEDAYDKSMVGTNNNSSDENKYLYGSYEPIIVTITHIQNERASVGWTSYSHTGVPVPVFAIGQQSNRFEGFYDNTDIAKNLARAMSIWTPMPEEKK